MRELRYTDPRTGLEVEIKAKDCDIPQDEMTRVQQALAPLHEAARGLPGSALSLTVIHHPKKQAYHVEAKLRLPGKTLAGGAEDAYLDSAFRRCVDVLAGQARQYADAPDRAAVAAAERRAGLDREVVMPEDPDAGPLARAVDDGDYRAFRSGLALYEDWLRGRVGRWVKRLPEAQALVDAGGTFIGDAVEEVYLLAFEGFARRRTDLRLSEWLDGLVDPAVRAALKDPDTVRAEASMARTVREGM